MCSSSTDPTLTRTTIEEPSITNTRCVRARDGYKTPTVRRTELMLGPTGSFRPLIEEYMTTVAPTNYKPDALIRVRGSICKFFRFVAQDLQIADLDQIRPSIITKFINEQRANGLTSHNFIGHLASFFVWLISEELYDRGNPVINRLHREQMSC